MNRVNSFARSLARSFPDYVVDRGVLILAAQDDGAVGHNGSTWIRAKCKRLNRKGGLLRRYFGYRRERVNSRGLAHRRSSTRRSLARSVLEVGVIEARGRVVK